MTFLWPWMLLGLAAVPLLAGLYALAQRRRPKYAARFTNLDLLANVVEASPNWRRHLPPALYLLAIAAVVFTLARPQLVTKTPRQEGTVVLVTDVSGSMNATDVAPTRMAAAQEAAHTLVDRLPKDFRISLISFSSGVNVLVPPTTEKEQVHAAIDRLTPLGGTAMGDALATAVDVVRAALEQQPAGTNADGTPATPAPIRGEGEAAPAVIVLLSDGAQTVGTYQPLDAAQLAADTGIPVYAIALGTPDGVAVVTDPQGRQRTVRVPPDFETLQAIAEVTGGRAFEAPGASQLESIYRDLGDRIGYVEERTEVSWAAAGLAGVLVLAGGALGLLWFNRFP
ncbi:MAG: VWA domain-containing protein [Tepidiforma sp.]|uniref:VWA domain-containing protein n=1 Tax=Tepidiforma sp. TaxID=2682230 RepID=UPI002611DAD0|nr:VWA domain-containing protein [Tepidiforma sp.]MCX7618680.1 VWA domain-containing protein [Tepidiforma sp.]